MWFQARRFAQASQRADAIARAEALLRCMDDAAVASVARSDAQAASAVDAHSASIASTEAFRAVVEVELRRWREEHHALQQRLAGGRVAAMREALARGAERG